MEICCKMFVYFTVTPTDRSKSVRNRYVIEGFSWRFCVVTLLFGFFIECWGFCHRNKSDLFLFLLHNVMFTMWYEYRSYVFPLSIAHCFPTTCDILSRISFLMYRTDTITKRKKRQIYSVYTLYFGSLLNSRNVTIKSLEDNMSSPN